MIDRKFSSTVTNKDHLKLLTAVFSEIFGLIKDLINSVDSDKTLQSDAYYDGLHSLPVSFQQFLNISAGSKMELFKFKDKTSMVKSDGVTISRVNIGIMCTV